MCLISIAGKGQDKYSKGFIEALTNGASSNTDGIGFAYKSHKTGKVFIGKGYKTINKLLSVLRSKRLTLKDELIVHLRIGNRGSVNTDMCHPFILSENKEEILANNQFVDLPVMAHNGTFFNYRLTSVYSDTYQFIQEFMYHPTVIDLLKQDKEFFEKCFEDRLKTNKLVYLFPNCDTELITLGNFIEDNGYLYSNLSFRNRSIRDVGGTTYPTRGNNHGWPDYALSERIDERIDDNRWNNHQRALNMKATAQSQINFVRDKMKEIEDDEENDVNFGIPREVLEQEEELIIRDSSSSTNSKIRGFGNNITDKEDVRIGYRKNNADEIPFIPLLYTKNERFKNVSRINYVEHFGLFIPEAFQEVTQFKAIQIKPTSFNFNDLSLYAIKNDEDYKIKRECYYLIQDIDESEQVITICPRYPTTSRRIFLNIPFFYINELFKVRNLPELDRKYFQYYRLIKDLPHSVGTLKRLKDFINTSEEYAKGLTFTFETVSNIERPALDLYKYNLVYHRFGDEDDQAEKFLNNKFLA